LRNAKRYATIRLAMRKQRRPIVRFNTHLILEDAGARGWMATDLARVSGVSDGTLSNALKGIRCTAKTVSKLAQALGHPVERYVVRSARTVAA
jgi:transcriptional regulator with XRE-family HTH domain